MRKAKQILAGNVDSDGPEATVPASAAGVALKENRLTFTWLDGETQKVCHFQCHFFKFLFL